MLAAQLIRVILLVFTAVTCIVIGDTAGKLLAQRGVDPLLVAWLRFALPTIGFLPFSGLRLRDLRHLRDPRLLLRGLCITAGVSCILTALKTEPIANVFGAFFVGPIVSYVLAVIFLNERPSPLRSLLLLIGFLGVLLVVKPGFGATLGMGFALAAGTFYGVYLVVTRTVANAYAPRFLMMSQLLIGAVVLAPVGLSVDMPELGLTVSTLMLISALASAVGNFLLVIANKTSEASLIAPLVYSQLLSATFLGIVVFGDWPDIYALAGLVLIALSGVGSLLVSRR